MRLRWVVISLAAFVLVLGALSFVLRWWAIRRMGPPPAPIVVKVPEVPEDNGYDNFVRAAKMYVETGVDPSDAPGAATTAAHRAALQRNQAALTELRRGIEKECVVPPKAAFTPQPSEHKAFRGFARLLVLESRVATDEGRFARAVQPLLDGLRFGAKLEVGAAITDRLVAHAIQWTMLSELQRLAGARKLDEEELLSALRVLGDIEAKAPPIEQTFEVESRQAAAAGPQLVPPGGSRAVLNPQKISAAVRDERDIAVPLARKPYAEVRAAIASGRPSGFTLSPSKALARTLRPVYERAIVKDFELRSRRRGTQLLLAVELHRLRHGKLPKSLAELQSLQPPAMAPSVVDPLTGKPYVYRLQGGEYVLYSVGGNLADDGGK